MIKRGLPWFAFISLLLLIIIGLASKDKLNKFLSNTIVKNAAPEIIYNGAAYVDSAYNYKKNGLSYQVTFLEFGAKGCSACKRMGKVMDEIQNKYPQRVNVVFLNIITPENQMLMKYYGIVAIPTQVLLNKKGIEYFRHTGYLPAVEMEKEIIYLFKK